MKNDEHAKSQKVVTPVRNGELPRELNFCDSIKNGLKTQWVLIKSSRKGRSFYVFLLSLIALIISSCMVGPDYKRPAVEVPQGWRFEEAEAADLVNTLWWKQFHDPVLDELITIALQENKDVRIATARIDEYLGRYRVTRPIYFRRSEAQLRAGGSAPGRRILPLPGSVG